MVSTGDGTSSSIVVPSVELSAVTLEHGVSGFHTVCCCFLDFVGLVGCDILEDISVNSWSCEGLQRLTDNINDEGGCQRACCAVPECEV